MLWKFLGEKVHFWEMWLHVLGHNRKVNGTSTQVEVIWKLILKLSFGFSTAGPSWQKPIRQCPSGMEWPWLVLGQCGLLGERMRRARSELKQENRQLAGCDDLYCGKGKKITDYFKKALLKMKMRRMRRIFWTLYHTHLWVPPYWRSTNS